MVLFFIWFGCRPSEVGSFCVFYEHVTLPKQLMHYDLDGVPQFLTVGFRDWKHRKAPAIAAGNYDMTVHRNYLDVKYCLLTWLLRYLNMSQMVCGPIFRDWVTSSGSTKAIDCYSSIVSTRKGDMTQYFKGLANETESRRVSATFTEANVSTLLRDIFDRAGYADATGYTFRRSSVKWWAICGAQAWEMRNAGRWKTEAQYFVYVEEGQLETQRNPADNPIRTLWVWQPNTWHQTLAPEFVGNRRPRI